MGKLFVSYVMYKYMKLPPPCFQRKHALSEEIHALFPKGQSSQIRCKGLQDMSIQNFLEHFPIRSIYANKKLCGIESLFLKSEYQESDGPLQHVGT